MSTTCEHPCPRSDNSQIWAYEVHLQQCAAGGAEDPDLRRSRSLRRTAVRLVIQRDHVERQPTIRKMGVVRATDCEKGPRRETSLLESVEVVFGPERGAQLSRVGREL